jgi:VIT1/CCC1 family predicted Fe2+/Mn2+ transporter
MSERRSESRDHPAHIALGGGTARAGVFGFSDGLVSNVSLVIGFASSGVGTSVVRLAGLAAAVAGAASMATGEWVSISAQNDLVRRELKLELGELEHNTVAETAELASIYESHGMSRTQALAGAAEVMRNPANAVFVHAREEFGLDPTKLPNPLLIGFLSLISFLAGAMLPVIPWFFAGGDSARLVSIFIGIGASAIVGAAIGRFAGRPMLVTAARQVGILLLATSVTYVIGRLVGVSV